MSTCRVRFLSSAHRSNASLEPRSRIDRNFDSVSKSQNLADCHKYSEDRTGRWKSYFLQRNRACTCKLCLGKTGACEACLNSKHVPLGAVGLPRNLEQTKSLIERKWRKILRLLWNNPLNIFSHDFKAMSFCRLGAEQVRHCCTTDFSSRVNICSLKNETRCVIMTLLLQHLRTRRTRFINLPTQPQTACCRVAQRQRNAWQK